MKRQVMTKWPVRCYLSEEMRIVEKKKSTYIVFDGAESLFFFIEEKVLRDFSLKKVV